MVNNKIVGIIIVLSTLFMTSKKDNLKQNKAKIIIY